MASKSHQQMMNLMKHAGKPMRSISSRTKAFSLLSMTPQSEREVSSSQEDKSKESPLLEHSSASPRFCFQTKPPALSTLSQSTQSSKLQIASLPMASSVKQLSSSLIDSRPSRMLMKSSCSRLARSWSVAPITSSSRRTAPIKPWSKDNFSQRSRTEIATKG